MQLFLLFAFAALALPGENVREPPPAQAQSEPTLTRAPELVEFYPADYPPTRLATGEQADVACLVDIDATGAVTQVAVEKSAAPEFDAAAVVAIRRFRFRPAELDGKPAPVRVRYVYHFVIEKKPAPAPQLSAGDAAIVRGSVVEAGTRKPVPGAEVHIPALGLSAVCDAEGRFELSSVSPGTHELVATAPGFSAQKLQIQLASLGIAERRFYLRRTVVGELSAVVAGERLPEGPTHRRLAHDEMVNVPGALNDPIRAVQNLPGLARVPFLGGALLVRGAPPAETGIYLEGERLPILYHFLGGPSVLNEQLLDRIDFYPGGYGAYYGRNLTGAIDVGTRKADAQGVHGSASLDLLEVVAFLEGPLGPRTQAAVAARRSHVDLFLPLFLPNDPKNGTTVVTPIYWDYQGRLDHRLPGGDELSFLATGSDDRLALIQKGGKMNQPLSLDSHVGFHQLRMAWKHAVSRETTLLVRPFFGWIVTSFNSSGIGQGGFARPQSGDLFDVTMGLRAEVRKELRSGASVRAGLDAQIDRYRVAADIQSGQRLRNLGLPITEPQHIDHSVPFGAAGGFVEADLKFGRLQLVPGLRLDQMHWHAHTSVTADPRLWARYTLSDRYALKAYAGVYHQPPSPLNADPSVGNPGLSPSWATQFGMGVEHRLSAVLSVSAEVFYNRRGRLVYSAAAEALPDGGIDNPLYRNSGIGRSFGLELLVRRELTSRLYGWLAYTLSKSEVLRRPDEAWRAFNFDQPHILTAVLGWRPSIGWEFSGRYRLVSGNPMRPVTSATFDADSGDFAAEQGRFGDARLPAFSQLDLRAQYTWTWPLWQLSAYLDVQNVLNRRNEEIRVYDYRFRDQGSIPGLPILPTLGAKARF